MKAQATAENCGEEKLGCFRLDGQAQHDPCDSVIAVDGEVGRGSVYRVYFPLATEDIA